MTDKQKQFIAITVAIVAIVALGLELFKQHEDNSPRGPMAPPSATGGKGAWMRAKREGKTLDPSAEGGAAPADQGPAAR